MRSIVLVTTVILALAAGTPTAGNSIRAAGDDSGHPVVRLGYSQSWISFDADFAGTISAVAWRDAQDRERTLLLSRSDDVSLEDFTTQEIAADVDDQAVAICEEATVMAYLQRAPDDDRRLWLAHVPVEGDEASSAEVHAPIGLRGSIDVACTGNRAYLAWTQQVDDEWHAFVRSVSLPDLALSTIHDAGPAQRSRITVAATDEHALVAWQEERRIRLARLRMDPDDEERLAPLSTRTVAERGKYPILDATGRHVALGFDRGKTEFILASRDGGRSFDQRERFGRRSLKGTPWELDSLAVDGRDIVATLVVYYGGDAWDRQRLRSHDRGRTWTTSRIDDPVAAIAKDGFLTTPDGVKVAEAYTDGPYASNVRLRVRREE